MLAVFHASFDRHTGLLLRWIVTRWFFIIILFDMTHGVYEFHVLADLKWILVAGDTFLGLPCEEFIWGLYKHDFYRQWYTLKQIKTTVNLVTIHLNGEFFFLRFQQCIYSWSSRFVSQTYRDVASEDSFGGHIFLANVACKFKKGCQHKVHININNV